MDRTVESSGRQQIVAPLSRAILPLAGLATICVLVVVFYYPVATVFAQAGFIEGHLSLAPLRGVLTDPFYVGAAHVLFADPLSVPGIIADWVMTFLTTAHFSTTDSFPFVVLVHGAGSIGFGLIGFTVYQALLSTLASLAVGLPGAWVLARIEFPGRKTVQSLTLLPFVLPAIMVAIGFVATFGSNGTLNDLLRWLSLPTVNLLYTLELVVLAHAFYNAPLVTRIIAAAWENIDERMTENARSLGASPLQAFRDVVLPQLLPSVMTAALLTFLFTFMTFPIVLALGGLQLATIEVWIYAKIQNLELQTAAALAVIETGISLALTYAYLRFEGEQTGLGGARGGGERSSLHEYGSLVRTGIAAYGIFIAVLFLVPLLSMIIESVTGPHGLTTRYYEFLIQRQTTATTFQVKPITAIRNSLVFGVATLVVAIPMGVTISVLTTHGKRGQKALDAILMAPLAVSGVVVGLGLLLSLVFGIEIGDFQLRVTGPLAIVAAHAVAAYPFVTRNVSPQLANVDTQFIEAARGLGASRVRVLLDIELPLVIPGLLAGAAFAFAISIGEFDSTVILAEGSASYTMPVAVERYLGGRSLGPATAMGTLLLAVTAVSFVVIERVGGRWRP
jgi:thiamine transport system permease protein